MGTHHLADAVAESVKTAVCLISKPHRYLLDSTHRELEAHLRSFEEESSRRTVRGVKPDGHVGNPFYNAGALDPVTRLVRWYNEEREHVSLKDGMETSAEAYLRKMPMEEEKTKDNEG